MKKNIFRLILTSAILIGLFSCQEEAELEPSYKDKNWLAFENDPSNPVTSLRYKIAQEQLKYIVFSDTLGSEQRYYPNSDSLYTHYELLEPAFGLHGNAISSAKYYTYDELNKEQQGGTLEYIELMNEHFIKKMPSKFNISTYFLIDTLLYRGKFKPASSYTKYSETSCLRCYNTMILPFVPEFNKLSDEEKEKHFSNIMFDLMMEHMLENEETWATTDFYPISEKYFDCNCSTSDGKVHSVYSTYPLKYYTYEELFGKKYINTPAHAGVESLQDLGFLGGSTFSQVPDLYMNEFGLTEAEMDPKNLVAPKKGEDFEQYVTAVLNMTVAEFTEKYGQYPIVMEKYGVFKKKLESLGYQLK